ncbi:MAG: recombination protein NinG [Ramlibacter sp.]|nr:recombination protein NinG [Ramlibacter sp.]
MSLSTNANPWSYRIGQARYEALEADNIPHKWTREELIGIRDDFRARLKELKKETTCFLVL